MKLGGLQSRAETFLNMEDVKDCDVKALEQLIEELKQLQKTTMTIVREIEALLIPLEKLLFKVSEGGNEEEEMTSMEIRQFKKFSKIIEASLQQKTFSKKKKKYYEGIIKEMRKLLPVVPLNLVNQTSTMIVNYIQLQQELRMRSKAIKIVRKAELKLREKFISPSSLKRLMMKIIAAENYFKCNSRNNNWNQKILKKIESLKSSLSAILSHAYIIDQCQKILTMSETHMSKFNLGVLMKNLGTIIMKSENEYIKITARELRIEMRQKFLTNHEIGPKKNVSNGFETSTLTSAVTEDSIFTIPSEVTESLEIPFKFGEESSNIDGDNNEKATISSEIAPEIFTPHHLITVSNEEPTVPSSTDSLELPTTNIDENSNTEDPMITVSSEEITNNKEEATEISEVTTFESDEKLFRNLTKLMRNEMKKFDVEHMTELQQHYEQIKEIHEKIPSHSGAEFTSITNEFDTYKSIVDNFQIANEILHNISHSLKHDNLTEAIIDNHIKLLNKAEEYLKTYHENKNLNDTSHYKYILQHKIELAGAQTSVNTINLAHKIIKMEQEEYENVHNSSVKDVLRSLEIITNESENEFLRTSASEVMIELRAKMQEYYEHLGDLEKLTELEYIKITLKNKTAIGGQDGLLKLNTSLTMLENSIKMHNVSEKVFELRVIIETINQIFLNNLEILRGIEEIIHIPLNQAEADELTQKIKILQEIIDHEYPDLKIISKAEELKELIIANIKDFHISNQIKNINMTLGSLHQSWSYGKNGMEIKQTMDTLDSLAYDINQINDGEEHHKDDMQQILSEIAKMKRLIPLKTAKVAIKKNAVILLKIVEQFINEMSAVGQEIDQIENELQTLEKFDSHQIDLSTLKDRKKQIVNDYGRILNDLEQVQEELVNMDLPNKTANATEIFGKDNVTMSDVIDTLVRLDNLLRDESTSSLYKATFRNMQELEHIESAIEQMKKMISRLKKYVKIPPGEKIESTITETSVGDNAETSEINQTDSSSIEEETTTYGNTNEEISITEAEEEQQQQQQQEGEDSTVESIESSDPNETQKEEVINSTEESVE